MIPFVDILLDNYTTKFKPGKFFYTSLLPNEATKESWMGGFIFQRVKKQCPKMLKLYKPNCNGEKKERKTCY